MAGEQPEVRTDPSTLTTEQLLREVDRVKELMMSEIQGLHNAVFQKFDAVDQLMNAKIAASALAREEKFNSVDKRLEFVESQRVEQKADTKAAVDAALTAQKEAVREQTAASERSIAKSEAATTKQIEQLTVTFTTAIKGVADLLSDTKDRVGKIESVKQGLGEGAGIAAWLVGTGLVIVGLVLTVYLSTRPGR